MKYLVLVVLILVIKNQEIIEKYKALEDTHHSLFKGATTYDRISGYSRGIPKKMEEEEVRKFANPDSYVAYKVAVFYKKIFEFLDEDIDDLLTEEDVVKAQVTYKWPVLGSEQEFVKDKFLIHDKNKDGKLDLIEFAHYMEDLWNVAAEAKKAKCLDGLSKAQKVFEQLFDFLDDDKDELLDARNLKMGLSYIMNKDINVVDVETVINKRGDKNQKLNREQFLLACVNNELLTSIEDKLITASFIE